MLGTPIWPDMRVPGPRLKNPGAIPGLEMQMEMLLYKVVVFFVVS